MQPPCSLQLGPCGPSPSLGSQGNTGSFQQLEEKQLFEKFWKGTFKAVATPRPESVIVASITARRRVTDDDDDGSMAGPGENEHPQKADVMLLIRPGLFVRDDSSPLLAVHDSSLAPPLCKCARGINAERLSGQSHRGGEEFTGSVQRGGRENNRLSTLQRPLREGGSTKQRAILMSSCLAFTAVVITPRIHGELSWKRRKELGSSQIWAPVRARAVGGRGPGLRLVSRCYHLFVVFRVLSLRCSLVLVGVEGL
ncbi:serine/arginine repetitive matrix protein 4 isoform X1 [Lates japonicus]|uniref:Serine/arginine repetitive matrix protein 4 isoform X1 n=1 Tax=Lates japonicus TaxID=270547 RepID=A0AAD3MI54_LATJO|nr:serine/arginine repetitive matrix protein 4 isoform X1 [Lates japonicus]